MATTSSKKTNTTKRARVAENTAPVNTNAYTPSTTQSEPVIEYEMPKSKVYVLLDDQNRITRIDGGYSMSNIKEVSQWTFIDEGYGDKYNLCQSNYLEKSLFTEQGVYRYKLVEGKVVERTEEEIQADRDLLPPTLLDMKNMKQEENKKALAESLAKNPIQWTDGNYYGITQEDQQEMSLNMAQYQLAKQAGVEDATLEWHSIKSKCKEWSIEDFTALTLAVAQKVYPYLRHQETIKEQIYACTTKDEVSKVEISYENI